MDKKLKIRKTVLLSLIAVLALIYALQLAFSNKTSRKVFELSQSPDFIQIEKDDSKITLVLEGGLWYMGEEKENVKDSSMEDILENLSAITTIETVSRNASQADYEKYGFQDIDSITVTAKSSGKLSGNLKSESRVLLQQQITFCWMVKTTFFLLQAIYRTNFPLQKKI